MDMSGFMERFDTYLVGRKFFEQMQRMEDAPPSPSDVREIVFSRTLDPADHPEINLETEAVRVVKELREQPGKDICLFGGGELFRSLLDTGLVDRVGVAIIPILLGGGIPLLPSPADCARLKLLSHKPYEKSGIAVLEYEVAEPDSLHVKRQQIGPETRRVILALQTSGYTPYRDRKCPQCLRANTCCAGSLPPPNSGARMYSRRPGRLSAHSASPGRIAV